MTRAKNDMHSALLVIDVQAGLTPGAYRIAEVIAAINKVANEFRRHDSRVIFIQHCHSSFDGLKKGNPGWQLDSRLAIKDADLFIEKEASDAFYATELEKVLAAHNINHIFIAGMQTEYCVDTTCRVALNKVAHVTLISDAHTTGNGEHPAEEIIKYHNSILAQVAHPQGNIDVISSDDLINQ